jgi:hypothetical protein
MPETDMPLSTFTEPLEPDSLTPLTTDTEPVDNPEDPELIMAEPDVPLRALPVETSRLPELPITEDSPVLTRTDPLEPTLTEPLETSASPDPPLTEDPAVRRLKSPDWRTPDPVLMDTPPPTLRPERPLPASMETPEPLPSSLDPTSKDTPPA